MRRLALLLSLSLAASCPAIANSATALLVGGTGQYATLTDEQMASAMGGHFADYTRVNVPYPGLPDDFSYSLEVGTDNLYAATYATAGPKTIGGVSEGAPVVIEVLRRLAKDPNPPSPDELDAVILATLSPVFYFLTGVTYHDVPETPYDVIVVKAEYDGVADWPDNWLNPLAVINAVMGAEQLHVSSAFYDIKTVPAKYVISTANSRGGVTTTVLIPTAVLPLLQPLVESGAPQGLIDFFDAVLRPIIDSAYRRFWIGTYAASSVAVNAAAAEPRVAVVEPNSSAVLEPEAPGAAPDRSLPERMTIAVIPRPWKAMWKARSTNSRRGRGRVPRRATWKIPARRAHRMMLWRRSPPDSQKLLSSPRRMSHSYQMPCRKAGKIRLRSPRPSPTTWRPRRSHPAG